jgi:hypothetical protein
MLKNAAVVAVVLSLIGPMAIVLDAQAQSEGLLRGEQPLAKRVGLTWPVLPPLDPPLVSKTLVLTPISSCRRVGAAGKVRIQAMGERRWEWCRSRGAGALAGSMACP